MLASSISYPQSITFFSPQSSVYTLIHFLIINSHWYRHSKSILYSFWIFKALCIIIVILDRLNLIQPNPQRHVFICAGVFFLLYHLLRALIFYMHWKDDIYRKYILHGKYTRIKEIYLNGFRLLASRFSSSISSSFTSSI